MPENFSQRLKTAQADFLNTYEKVFPGENTEEKYYGSTQLLCDREKNIWMERDHHYRETISQGGTGQRKMGPGFELIMHRQIEENDVTDYLWIVAEKVYPKIKGIFRLTDRTYNVRYELEGDAYLDALDYFTVNLRKYDLTK